MIPEQRRERLNGCDPELIKRVGAVINEMELLGKPMMVLEGYRTVRRQQALYAQGRSKPGKIVTNLDGVARKSKHQLGRAADCVFRGRKPYDGDWATYGRLAKQHGLVWGGTWTMRDLPHVELP